MVLTLSWRRNIDIRPLWDILYKSSLPENTLLLFLVEYHGMSWRFASVLPFTDWCVLENISDTGCLVHAPFIYLLLHSSDMFGHPCLQCSVCHQGSMMAISACFNTQDENARCRFASVLTYLYRSLILDWPLEILPLFNCSVIHSGRESPPQLEKTRASTEHNKCRFKGVLQILATQLKKNKTPANRNTARSANDNGIVPRALWSDVDVCYWMEINRSFFAYCYYFNNLIINKPFNRVPFNLPKLPTNFARLF